MPDLLNKGRPPVFCPGCSHDRIARVLDKSFENMGLRGDQIVMVSDIGCSGLFDTFFNTHAFHGLHGRALTYATGLKLARPELNVVVTMGDGGIGIGGAHLLSACRRNLNLTLLILNNFNFGMTGGQFSATTPPEAQVGSGFLNRLEQPLDVCQLARAAGATYVTRSSAYRKDLQKKIEQGIRHEGFSVIDIWGVCPGRYTKRNRLTPQIIEENLAALPPIEGVVEDNLRKEYGRHYREMIEGQKPLSPPIRVETRFDPPQSERQGVIILGEAGQRIITAGEILSFAGLTAGLKVTQKNEYNITVLRGPSISEVILSREEIGFTGIERPTAVIAIGQEGVDRRNYMFHHIEEDTLIIRSDSVDLPPSEARVYQVDFKAQDINPHDRALASLAVLAKLNRVISPGMLRAALEARFKEPNLTPAIALVDRIEVGP